MPKLHPRTVNKLPASYFANTNIWITRSAVMHISLFEKQASLAVLQAALLCATTAYLAKVLGYGKNKSLYSQKNRDSIFWGRFLELLHKISEAKIL